MPEQKLPKSWGNGYFRITIMDLIKLAVFLLSAFAVWHKLDNSITIANSERAAIEKRVDRIEKQHDSGVTK